MNNIFTENLKKFRLAKGLTQEQVADKLNVNAQTVSRWECGTTLPDVLTLPELARLYEVTVDDFYKKNSVAYDNYAQRLASVFEDSHDIEDFIRADAEFKKLIKSNSLTTYDMWEYGMIHYFLMHYGKENAFRWFDKVLEKGESDDEFAYWKTRTQRMKLCSQLGKNEENIKEQREIIENNPDNVNERELLLAAYMYAGHYKEAYEEFKKAVAKFPDRWELYIHGGDISKKLGKYNEAMEYYNKAGEIGSCFCDELYCKADLYESLGEYEKSVEMYMKIADTLRQRGYDVEADMAEKDAQEVKKKIKE
ncbi:MAG: helix-turn-helix domain-containing protein [Clostridia bacterium]|nr:helix-turn-helix domain-containing protein [Clostridia bacterium]